MSRKTRILILGGGSGGLELAAQLAGRRDIDVTLIDRVTSHLWKPRLHEFAAGTVSSSLAEISFYILGQLRGFRFEQGEVVGIEHAMKAVRLAPMRDERGAVVTPERLLTYDYCVVALGGVTPDFNTTGVAEHAVRLDGQGDAEAFRQRFIRHMIRARSTGVPADIVIIGSGATGTELAAHLRHSERAFFDWSQNAPGDSPKLLNLTILEAAPELMPGAEPALRDKLLERLRALDIKVVTDAKITRIDAQEIRTATGESWPSDITVWAAGLIGNPILARLGAFKLDKKGRILVDTHLRSTTDDAVYVMGDSAACTPEGADAPLPPTAQAASQQAQYLAQALPRVMVNAPVEDFTFRNKGRLVSLAGAGAVGMIGLRRRDDILIHGQFAAAAYDALQRQHQWRVLGPLRGSVAIMADLISPTAGPPLKLHGG